MICKAKSQRGSLIITLVILIAVVGLLASSISFLVIESERVTVDYVDSTSALFFAESGIQKGRRELSLNSAYTGEGPTAFGSGSFSITVSTQDASGNPLPTNQRRVTSLGSIGSVNAVLQSVEEIVSIGTPYLFYDPFDGNIAQWPVQSPNGVAFLRTCPSANTSTRTTQGSVSYTTNTAPGSVGGAFQVLLFGRNNRRTGYHEAALTAIPAGRTVRIELWYTKYRYILPNEMMMAVDLVSTTGNVYRVWSNCSKSSVAWTQAAPVTWVVPAGQTINRVRLAYDLEHANRDNLTIVRFDEIRLTLP